ncbi:hypothetical protein PG996_004391 [Apiospora saccharicola]|uniref:Uncharacterized protein n=1 Tax=Apiospora saccharicola TaxID=335842 RepID=A0ABR1W409_9PEZI
MQFARVNPRNDLALSMPIKPPVKQYARTKPQHPPKSSPPDPDDLRRRLYAVLSEQNAQREARRQARAQKASNGAVDLPLFGSAAVGDVDTAVTSVYTTRSSAALFEAKARAAATNAAAPGLRVVIAPPRADANSARRGSQGASNQEKTLRRADSKMDAVEGAKDVKRSKSLQTKKLRMKESAQEEQPAAEPYHHVPQVAAQQFARTATAKASMSDMSTVHPLARQALKFHIDGSAAERTELEHSKSPAEQNRALRRAQSTRERLQERNQFQDDAPLFAASVATAIPARNKRHSLPAEGFVVGGPMLSSSLPDSRNQHHHHWNWANMGDIVEDTPLYTNNFNDDDHYHYQSGEVSQKDQNTHRRQRSRSFADLLPSCRPVDADGEPLVVRNNATGADRRADWAQKDERDLKLSQQQSHTNKVPRGPLLRKADSLWALKEKIVSVSTGRLHHNSSKQQLSGNKSRDSANSSETGRTTSPVKSLSRGGFFARLRRLS